MRVRDGARSAGEGRSLQTAPRRHRSSRGATRATGFWVKFCAAGGAEMSKLSPELRANYVMPCTSPFSSQQLCMPPCMGADSALPKGMNAMQIDEFWNRYIAFAFARKTGGPEKLFRGVTNKAHKLIPSIGRLTEDNTNGDIATLENMLIDEFRRLAIAELSDLPKTEFEWLFLAQHYGLPTRLLDWSSNPLVALYFAAERHDDVAGVVYAAQHSVSDQYALFDPKTADYTAETAMNPVSRFALQPSQGNHIFVRPKYTDRRYANQQSIFCCSKDPWSELTIPGMGTIELPGELKPDVRTSLKKLGISGSFIYPGDRKSVV